jgi:hypothetical protein
MLDAPDLATGIKMGVGSSLTHLLKDPDNVFYSTADRGPNGDITVNGVAAKSFPLKVNGTDSVSGKANITGLPNIKGRDEVAYDAKGEKALAYDPYGLDIEGIAYNPKDKTFWISD